MEKNRKIVEDTQGEEYIHRYVWRIVQRQLDYAAAQERGSLYDDLTAMVFAFHSLEGYLNYIGALIAPELWANEKASFKVDGIGKKLTVICSLCGLGLPVRGKRPFSTVLELKRLRDLIAHPKTLKNTGKIIYDEGKPPPLFRKSHLSNLVSHEKALRARDDIKIVADQIHSAARGKFPHVNIGPSAFDGIMGISTTSAQIWSGN